MISKKRIYISTRCLPEVDSLISRLSRYQKSGFDAIELGSGVSADKDSLSQIAGMGFTFLIHNYFPAPPDEFVLNLASSNAAIRKKSIDFVLEALALAARLDIPFYSVHAGFVTDPTVFNTEGFVFPEPDSPDAVRLARERFVLSLEVVLDYARKFGVGLLIENNVCPRGFSGKLLLQTAEEFTQLFRLLPAPQLGVLLDTGHLNVTAHTLDFDRLAFVEQIAPYVRAFHVHDNDGITDAHQPVHAGSWVLDVLRRPEFAGLPIIIESNVKSTDELQQYAGWLKSVLI